ncbi:MAG: hypothetical protein MI741_04705, partial [Rhodospirillales bacterium]|nr:hypothetical protein [Rhodospirillales bacterium]
AAAVLAVVAAMMLLSSASYSQPGDSAERSDRRRGGWDREAMRERMSQFMQDRLQCTEEEWEVMEPMVTKIRGLQAESSGMRGMSFRRGDRGNDGEEREESATAKATRELREVLEDEDAKAEAIKAKLDALRKARKAGAEKLAEARKELRGILTQRQEAEFVLMTVLD